MHSLEGDPITELEVVRASATAAGPSGHHKSYADLGYPWDAPAVPDAMLVEASARAWTAERGLVPHAQLARRFDPVNVGLLTSLCYAGASRERRELIAQLLGWIFVHDDVYDDATHDPERLRAVLAGYAAILRGDVTDPLDASPSTLALVELRERIAAIADPTWLDWFCESMRGFWLDGIVVETAIRASEVTPDVPTYLRMRLHSIGVLPFLDLVELAHGFAIPRVVVADPSMMRLRMRTARVIAYANDVFSYEKERRAGDPNNLVHLLMHHDGLSLVSAVDRVIQLHDREVALFESEAALVPFASLPHVDEFIAGHRAWMRGALDWQRMSHRYTTGRDLLDRGLV